MPGERFVPSEPLALRAVRACDACRTKKIKCDGVKPLCDGCKHSKIPCTYVKPHRSQKQWTFVHGQKRCVKFSRPKPTPSEKKTQALERSTPSTTQSDSSASFPRPRGHPSFNVASLKAHILSCKFGDVESVDGSLIISSDAKAWVKSRTGEDVDFAAFFISDEQPHIDKNGADIIDPYKSPLPTKEEMRDMASCYFDSESQKLFPVFSQPFMFSGIEAVYDSLDRNQCIASGRAFILIMLAFYSECHLHHPRLDQKEKSTFSEAALQLLPDILREPVTPGGFGTIVVMCTFQSTTGNLDLLEQTLSMAVRMLFTLGGHLRDNKPSEAAPGPGIAMTPIIRQQLRKLFFVLYRLDKDLCFRTLRPPLFNDDFCDFEDDNTAQISIDTRLPVESFFAFHPADIKLALLKGKIYHNLYSVTASKLPDTELLRRIRELDEELDGWRSTLPITSRPDRSHTQNISEFVAQNLRLILLHLEYYQALIMIHRVSKRCVAWRGHEGTKISAIQTSVDLCLEASRSTIHYLQASRQLPGGESFWVISHFPISALVMIFCNILQYPRSPRAMDDLALLSVAPKAFEKSLWNIRTEDATLLRPVHLVFQELSRLAKCAIERNAVDS